MRRVTIDAVIRPATGEHCRSARHLVRVHAQHHLIEDGARARQRWMIEADVALSRRIVERLAQARHVGQKFDIMSTSYFLNRRTLRAGRGTLMPHWMARVFVTLYRSASEPTNYYRLPSNRVVELGQQMNI